MCVTKDVQSLGDALIVIGGWAVENEGLVFELANLGERCFARPVPGGSVRVVWSVVAGCSWGSISQNCEQSARQRVDVWAGVGRKHAGLASPGAQRRLPGALLITDGTLVVISYRGQRDVRGPVVNGVCRSKQPVEAQGTVRLDHSREHCGWDCAEGSVEYIPDRPEACTGVQMPADVAPLSMEGKVKPTTN